MLGFIVVNATFNNISVVLWRSVLLVEETGGPIENHWPRLRGQRLLISTTWNICMLIHVATWKHDWDQPELFLNKGIKTVYLFMKLSVKTINNMTIKVAVNNEESTNMTRVLVFSTSKHLGHSLSIQGAGNVSTWITQFIASLTFP